MPSIVDIELNLSKVSLSFQAQRVHGRAQMRATASGAGTIQDMSPQQLKVLLDQDEDMQLIDVREEYEHEIAKLPDFELLPLSR